MLDEATICLNCVLPDCKDKDPRCGLVKIRRREKTPAVPVMIAKRPSFRQEILAAAAERSAAKRRKLDKELFAR
jgi:hypothetical protein